MIRRQNVFGFERECARCAYAFACEFRYASAIVSTIFSKSTLKVGWCGRCGDKTNGNVDNTDARIRCPNVSNSGLNSTAGCATQQHLFNASSLDVVFILT